MRIFVAGATGAIGKALVSQLVEHGHEVAGTTRSEARAAAIWDRGAKPVVVDPLDRDAVIAAVKRAEPDVVVHELTALAGVDLRRFEQTFAMTNRLRTEALDHLLAAATAAGAERIVAQSYAGWPYAREGGPVKTEADPLDPTPAASMRATLEAIRHVEAVVTAADGIVLRYGALYGPGTGMEPGGDQVEAIRKRRFPLLGEGRAVWSFVHVDDAAAATVAAIERGAPGIYNVVDDDPAPVSEWLPHAAEVVGARPPRRLPLWLGRLVGGEHMVVLMDQARAASNAKARAELGWEPRYPSWRTGFRAVLSPTTASATRTLPASTRSLSRS